MYKLIIAFLITTNIFSQEILSEKNRAEVLRQQQNKKFSEIADLYISTKKKDEWTNPKSEQQWRSTITHYAVPVRTGVPSHFCAEIATIPEESGAFSTIVWTSSPSITIF